jgi:hypothetical protein
MCYGATLKVIQPLWYQLCHVDMDEWSKPPVLRVGAMSPSYLGDRDQENCGLRPTQTKSSQDPVSTNGWIQWHISVILATWGNVNKRISVQASSGIKQDHI